MAPTNRVFVFLAFLIFGWTLSEAQNPKIDALKAELPKHSPTNIAYLELVLQIADEFRFVNADSVLHYAALGRRIGNKTGQYQFACKWEDLSAMSFVFKGENDSAMLYAKRQMKLAEETQEDSLLVQAYSRKAMVFQAMGKIPDALGLLLEAIELGRKNGNIAKSLSYALNTAGVVFRRAGAYSEAAQYLSEALELAIQRKDTLLESALYGNLGNVFFAKMKYEKALPYYLKYYHTCQGPAVLGLALGNIGICYTELGNLDSASKYVWKSHELFLERRFSAELATSYNSLGSLELLRGDTLKAIAYWDSSLSWASSAYKKSGAYSNIGQTLAQLGQDDSAVVYMEKALWAANAASSKGVEANIRMALSEQYIKMGQVQKGYMALKSSKEIVDSLRQVNDGMQEVIALIREKQEKKRLQREVSLTQRLNEELENKWYLARWALAISLAFAIVFVLFLRTKSQLARAKLRKKEGELDQEQKRLHWRSESLRYSTAHNQINHHSLFFNIGKIQSLLDSRGEGKLADELEMHLGHIRKVIDLCRQEESNLAEELKVAAGLVAINRSQGFQFKLQNETEEDLDNIAFPTLGLLPLIENALQHSDAPSGAEKLIETTVRSHEGRLFIAITNPTENADSSTNGSNHKSVGLDNCKERISIWTQQYRDEARLSVDFGQNRAEATLDIPIIHFDD